MKELAGLTQRARGTVEGLDTGGTRGMIEGFAVPSTATVHYQG